MGYVKWSVIMVLIGVFVAFLHYYLPSQDVVRVVRTETVRVDVETTDAQGNPAQSTRDQNRIYTFTPNSDERVYRNEDTGWGFPWYFKFDTANLAAAAEDAVSTRNEPEWYVMRHYGWRIPMLSMFPNALTIREAEGPDQTLIPWFNIVFLIVLALLALMVRRILITLRERHVDPMIEDIDQGFDESAGWWRRQWRRFFN